MVRPSNLIAALDNPGKRMLPNLARGCDKKPEECPEVNERIENELAEAGIDAWRSPFPSKGEVPTNLIGFKRHWTFERRWYYYAASGAGIPPQIAEEFHKTWGKQVRVSGHCGCPSPLEWCHGFAIDSYHIDTQDGLNAFAALLDSIHIPQPDHPHCGGAH